MALPFSGVTVILALPFSGDAGLLDRHLPVSGATVARVRLVLACSWTIICRFLALPLPESELRTRLPNVDLQYLDCVGFLMWFHGDGGCAAAIQDGRDVQEFRERMKPTRATVDHTRNFVRE